MLTGIYGRQWNNPTPEYAAKRLLDADQACKCGKAGEA